MKLIIISLLLSVGISAGHAGETGGKLGNRAIAWSWHLVGGKLRPIRMDDRLNETTLNLNGECFQLVLGMARLSTRRTQSGGIAGSRSAKART